MNILITGASGFIGRNVLSALAAKYNISACVHKNEIDLENNQGKTIQLDFRKMQNPIAWLPHLKNIDVVINCVGIISQTKKSSFNVMHYLTPIALFKACKHAGVKRIIQISALGADNTAQVDFHRSKKLADDFLKTSSLRWFILRPSLVYGDGGKSFVLFQKLSNLPIVPLIGDGTQMIQPVHINTLVRTIKKCLSTQARNQILDVVGQHSISYKQWMLHLRTRTFKPSFIRIPITMVKFVTKLFKPLNLQLLSKDNLTMLEQNNVGNYSQLKKFLEN